MIKIEAIFQCLRRHEEYVFITNNSIVPGSISKCLYCFFEGKENKWYISWTKSNIHDLLKCEKANINKRITYKDVPKDLLDIVQQRVNEANSKDEVALLKIKEGI